MANEIKGGGNYELSTDINVITAEINAYQRVAGEAIFEIGRRLHYVKYHPAEYKLPEGTDKHGNTIVARGAWGEWLAEVNIDNNMATRFMKIVEELGDGKSWTSTNNLGMDALYQIATLPPEHREVEHELPSGETKKPEDMTVRELRELKKALKQAQQQAEAERRERERLEEENEQLAKQADKPAEVRAEYVEVKDEIAERKLKRYEELFGDVSMYEGKTTRVTNGDAITYAIFEFSEDVRKFIEKYGHLTHFAREFNEMIGEGKEEYRKAIGDMVRFLGAIERNLAEEETIIING